MPRQRPTTHKRCPSCRETKPITGFYRGRSYEKRSGGLSPYCKPCMLDKASERTPEQKARYRAQQRRRSALYYAKHQTRLRAYTARRAARLKAEDPAAFRAKKFFDVRRPGVATDVTVGYLADLFRATTHCHCCGVVLVVEYAGRQSRGTRANPFAPSIDRVNNRKGYTRSNIAVICWRCNFRKTDLTLDDLEMLARYIKRYGDFADVM